MESFIAIALPILLVIINCRSPVEMEVILHPAVIKNVNDKIDEILRRFPYTFPPNTNRDIELFQKLTQLHSAKLEDDATEDQENEALAAIFLFHDFLETRWEMKLLLDKAVKEILRVFVKTNHQGSLEDMIKLIQAFYQQRGVLHQAIRGIEGNEDDDEGEEILRSHYLRVSAYLRSLHEDGHNKWKYNKSQERSIKGTLPKRKALKKKFLNEIPFVDKESNENFAKNKEEQNRDSDLHFHSEALQGEEDNDKIGNKFTRYNYTKLAPETIIEPDFQIVNSHWDANETIANLKDRKSANNSLKLNKSKGGDSSIDDDSDHLDVEKLFKSIFKIRN